MVFMQKIIKSPFIIAAFICFIIAIAIPFALRDSKEEIKGVSQKISPSATPSATPAVSAYKNKLQAAQTQTYVTSVPVSTAQNPSVSFGSAQDKSSGQVTSAPTQAIKTFQVSLKINGSAVGAVDVQEGNNQCDVLSKAKDQGRISQLFMKYESTLGTYGVYQINGQGSENVVWWTYKVNGTAPTQGCSYIKANSGDNVEWEYKGN